MAPACGVRVCSGLYGVPMSTTGVGLATLGPSGALSEDRGLDTRHGLVREREAEAGLRSSSALAQRAPLLRAVGILEAPAH